MICAELPSPFKNTSILMKDGDVDEINTGMSLGARIRVLNNGAWGFAYTTDLSKINETGMSIGHTSSH